MPYSTLADKNFVKWSAVGATLLTFATQYIKFIITNEKI